MLNPVVMIGCGGSGTKAVRYVRAAVQRRLDAAGWRGPMPDAWSFVGVDTVESQLDGDPVPPLPANDYVWMTQKVGTYRALHASLMQQYPASTNPAKYRHLIGWRPHPSGKGGSEITIGTGCSQIRGIGRAVGLYLLAPSVGPKLRTSFNNASSGAGLKEVSEALSLNVAGPLVVGPPLVVVCASAAGGTGAGVALDVVDMVRRTHPDGGNPILILFSADIFGNAQTSAMAANSLGVIAEALAGYWNPSDASGAGDIFDSGVVPSPGHGPSALFVVGSRNMSDAEIGGSNVAVYRAVGEALSGWVVDDTVQQNLVQFIQGNWTSDVSGQGGYPFPGSTQNGAVSSFGAATVSVGLDRFETWSVDLLTRRVYKGLLSGHLSAGRATLGDDPTEFQIVDYWGDRFSGAVYGDQAFSGQPVDVTDFQGVATVYTAFLSQGETEALEKWADDKVTERFPSPSPDGERRRGVEWKDDITHEVGLWYQSASDRGGAIGDVEIAKWSRELLDHLSLVVSEVIAETSLAVAKEAVEDAKEAVRAQAEESERLARDERDAASAEFNERMARLADAGRRVDRGDPKVEEGLRAAAGLLVTEWRSSRLESIAAVLNAVDGELYAGLDASLHRARQEVGNLLDEMPVASYPQGVQDQPVGYLPSTVELPLVKPEGWRDLLIDLCNDMKSEATEHKGSLEAVRWRIVAGDDDLSLAPIVRVSDVVGGWVAGTGIRVQFDIDVKPETVRRRTQALTETGKFGTVVGEGLKSYLNDTDPHGHLRDDHTQRLKAFDSCLTNALTMSTPMVQIDDALSQIVHGAAKAPDTNNLLRLCSAMPFSKQHPAYKTATELLGANFVGLAQGDVSSVLISSYIKYPVHPMVVSSLTEPIATAASQCSGPDALQADFWLWRRTRTLPSFVPLTPEMRQSMIRGFAVGRLCGYITVSPFNPATITGQPPPGWDDQASVQFPWPLLSAVKNNLDVLPALLESFALTFAEVSSKQLAAFEPYRRLYELGQPRGYTSLWSLIDEGRPQFEQVDTPKVQGITPEERQESTLTYLTNCVKTFRHLESREFIGNEYCSDRGLIAGNRNVLTVELLPEARECFEEVTDEVRDRANTAIEEV